jgi:hypothetical protein
MGIAELAGAYFPNYMVTISSAEVAPRNTSMLTLVPVASSLAPALHGALTDWFGYWASFTFGTMAALLSLWLVVKLPAGPTVSRKATNAQI